MKYRVYKKRVSRLKKFRKWQKNYIAGHHYRWMVEVKGMTGMYVLAPIRINNIEKYHSFEGPHKQLEKNRLKLLWRIKFYYKG